MMQSFKVKIPLTNLQPPKTFQDDLANSSSSMVSNFGNYFRAAAAGTNLPVQFLYAIAMVEETGTHYNPNGTVHVEGGSLRSTGIMQIDPESFYEHLKVMVKKNRLSQDSINILNKYLPNFSFDNLTATTQQLNTIFLALKKPEFNIWAGAMVLRDILEQTSNPDGTLRPDKAIIKYNIGEYSLPTKLKVYISGDTTSLVKSVNPTTANYIVKVTGINGAMDYFLKNNIS